MIHKTVTFLILGASMCLGQVMLPSYQGFSQQFPPVPFSYWRMNVLNSGSFTAASLFSFYDGTGTLIPVTGGTASASNAAFGPAANAFDGVSSDFWNAATPSATPTSPVTLQMHFTSAVVVGSIKLQARAGNLYGPDTFQMQASNDNSTWINKGFYNPPTPWTDNASGTVQTFIINSASGSGTAWRVLITGTQGSVFCEIGALKFFDGVGSQITTTPSTGYVFASTEFDSTHPAQYVFLSPYTHFWASLNAPSVGSPEYIGFRSNSTLSSIGSFSITNVSVNNAPTTMKLQKSDDFITWTDVQSYTAATWTVVPQTQTFTVP